ncbi:MAG: LytR/AlgR family response regulator transcription factor [Flavobacteriales bacterium]|jgi:DNA-binding LytR/AlgR family response regulator
MIRYLVVEDEQPAARRLIRMIGEMRPDWTLAAQADSIEDAAALLTQHPAPDLAFLDIQLADGLSFDIFQRIDVPCPVVFTTAYDHYAIKAFRVNGLDYLLKPVEPEGLMQSIQRFEESRKKPVHSDDLRELIASISRDRRDYRRRFLVKTAGRLAFIPVQDIAYAFSDDGSAFIVTRKNERYLVESTLEEMEGELSPDQFFRINRGLIVSMDAIVKIEPHFSNRLMLQLNPAFDNDVFVSRQRAAEFKSWLDQ